MLADPIHAPLPTVIQGGMGVGVSGWRLARAVGETGQMGVVSGTAIDVVHARVLEDGDPGGHLRRAYAHFPVAQVVERVLARWFSQDGRVPGQKYRNMPLADVDSPQDLRDLTVLSNFAEVWLAKDGHDGPIGVNFLEKVQIPTPDAIYGTMLAGVDYILMGAGIPAGIPRLIRDLAGGQQVSYAVSVAGAEPGDHFAVRFDPAELFGGPAPHLARPQFLAIISSNTLASFLLKDPETSPDGFVVEGPTAGGHNAPPRGKLELNDKGEPMYGPRDSVDLAKLGATGVPFWLAGGYNSPERRRLALESGAAGVQVGTPFALCDESGIRSDLKEDVIRQALDGHVEVRTDPLASPSGYPFKVMSVPGTMSDADVYEQRTRVCDLGMLRSAYKKDDGTVGWRCAAEPVKVYVSKGGSIEDTVGRKCLCNGLLSTIGLGQERPSGAEPPIVTIGDDVIPVVRALAADQKRWSAAEVVTWLLGKDRES